MNSAIRKRSKDIYISSGKNFAILLIFSVIISTLTNGITAIFKSGNLAEIVMIGDSITIVNILIALVTGILQAFLGCLSLGFYLNTFMSQVPDVKSISDTVQSMARHPGTFLMLAVITGILDNAALLLSVAFANIPFLGILLIFLPLILLVYISLIWYLFILDPGRKPFEYIKRSVKYISGDLWGYLGFSFGTVFFITIGISIVTFIVSLFSAAVSSFLNKALDALFDPYIEMAVVGYAYSIIPKDSWPKGELVGWSGIAPAEKKGLFSNSRYQGPKGDGNAMFEEVDRFRPTDRQEKDDNIPGQISKKEANASAGDSSANEAEMWDDETEIRTNPDENENTEI